MDKRRTKVFRDKLLDRREGLVGQVQAAELYSRERDAEATQDPADMAANAYTKELLVSMSDNDRQLLNLIDEALERIETAGYGKCVHCGEVLAGEASRCGAVGASLCSLPGSAGARVAGRRRRVRTFAGFAASSNNRGGRFF
jgi:DnaK suppressor protein